MYGNPFNSPMQQFPFMAPKANLAPALYVGDLDESIQEEYLYDYFSRFGSIHFVRIMRDNTTGKSRGYAFVNFVQPRDAESAKQYAQYEKLGNKHIRIMFKRPMKDVNPEANVYVKNIDPNTNVKDLHNHFNQAGTVLSAKISTDSQGNSLGYGYVQFEKVEEAENAINLLNNVKLNETELQVIKFQPKDKRAGEVHKRNLYIKNLPTLADAAAVEALVKQLFNKFGTIEKMAVTDKNGKWAAFVCYKTPEEAQAAIDNFTQNKVKLENCEEDLYVGFHQSKKERSAELSQNHAKAPNLTNLYVKNLKLDVTDEQLKAAFIQFGPITSVSVKTWNSTTGQKQAKFGFIAFQNAEDAKRANQDALSNQQVRALYLANESAYINLHQSKEKRTEFIQSKRRANFQKNMMGMDFRPPFMPYNNFVGARRFPPMPQTMGGFAPKGPQQQRPQRQFQTQNRMPGGPSQNRNQGKMTGGRPQQSQYNTRPQTNNNQPPKKVDNKPVQQQAPKTQPAATPQIAVSSLKSKLNEFLGMTQDKQRQILGELLFPKVRAKTNDILAPKITGMLIDLSVLEVSEILEFLEDEALLTERVQEAAQLIQESEQ